MKTNLYAFKAFLATSALAVCHAGEPSALVSYQGRLLDGTNPVSGLVSMRFRFYTAETNGECVFEEVRPVPVSNGLYSTMIGNEPLQGSIGEATKVESPFLEIAVNGATLTPRQRFVPPPFALRSTETWRLFLSPDVVTFDAPTLENLAFCRFGPVASWEGGARTTAVFPPATRTLTIVSARCVVGKINPRYPRTYTGQPIQNVQLRLHSLSGDFLHNIGSPLALKIAEIPENTWLDIPLPKNATENVIRPDEILNIWVTDDLSQTSTDQYGLLFMFEVQVR